MILLLAPISAPPSFTPPAQPHPRPPHLHIHVWLLNDRDREGERRRDNLEDEVKRAGSVRMTKDTFIDSVQDGNTRTYRHTHTHTCTRLRILFTPCRHKSIIHLKMTLFFSLSLSFALWLLAVVRGPTNGGAFSN